MEQEKLAQYKKRWPMLTEKTIEAIAKIQEENSQFIFRGITEKDAAEHIRRYKTYKGEFLKPDEITPEQRHKISQIKMLSCWIFDGKTRQEAKEFIESNDKYLSDFSLKEQDVIKYRHVDTKERTFRRLQSEKDFKHKARLTWCFDCKNTDETCEFCYKKKFVNIYGEFG